MRIRSSIPYIYICANIMLWRVCSVVLRCGVRVYAIIRKYRWNRLKCEAENPVERLRWRRTRGNTATENECEAEVEWMEVGRVWVQNYRKGTTRRENKHNFLGLSPHSLARSCVQRVDNKRGILLCTYFINCMSRVLLRVRIGRVHFELSYIAFIRRRRSPT